MSVPSFLHVLLSTSKFFSLLTTLMFGAKEVDLTICPSWSLANAPSLSHDSRSNPSQAGEGWAAAGKKGKKGKSKH